MKIMFEGCKQMHRIMLIKAYEGIKMIVSE